MTRVKEARKRSPALHAMFPESVLDSYPSRCGAPDCPRGVCPSSIVADKADCPLGADSTSAFQQWLLRLMRRSLAERHDVANPQPAAQAQSEWTNAQVDLLIKEFIRPQCTHLTLASLMDGTAKLLDIRLNEQQDRATHLHADPCSDARGRLGQAKRSLRSIWTC